jgi:hypothetical protein
LSAGRALVDENAMTNPTAENWGTFEGMTFDEIPVVSLEDVESGLLFLARINNLRPWSADVRMPDWKYVPYNTEAGIWGITQNNDEWGELGNYTGGETIPGGIPVVWKTDAMVPSDVVRYQDKFGNWIINTGFQMYYGNGDSLVLPVKFTGDYADPNSDKFNLTRMLSSNPTWAQLDLIVTDSSYASSLPPELLAKIEEYRGKPEVDSATTGIVMAGEELPGIQDDDLKFAYIIRMMQWYLLDPSDDSFNSKYPPKP